MSMNMLLGEFMTAVQHRLPLKVVIFNNSALGLITLEAESDRISKSGFFRYRSRLYRPRLYRQATQCPDSGD
jgi:thiamine pyrophosphate-dependent acetolactate synthase large subunit-like protein